VYISGIVEGKSMLPLNSHFQLKVFFVSEINLTWNDNVRRLFSLFYDALKFTIVYTREIKET
jgi:hypothetical protein